MTRRNLLTSLLGLLAAWFGWKAQAKWTVTTSDEPPPYKVMKLSPAAAQLADLEAIRKAVEKAAMTINQARKALDC